MRLLIFPRGRYLQDTVFTKSLA